MREPAAAGVLGTPDASCALGILGGTFDPVHFGHLRLAEEARLQLGLAAVRWIPAGQPGHRHTPTAAAAHRLAMVRLAIAGQPAFQLDDGEVLSSAPSYSVPTLQRLRAERGALQPLVLLLGADAFLGLESWHRWRELFGLAHIAVATRPGFALALAALPPLLATEFVARATTTLADLHSAPAGRILSFPITPLAISATQLRAQLKAGYAHKQGQGQGHSVRYLLPDPVLDYIFLHQLYS
ncbi:MAG: nicotinate-nucleotide adenylyltransferase [Sterolibacterium sp.]|jgi:nicotinate-nucleotide adenylyltransferase|nr:nicotinate-nucleotide adenylyltransferase [Sterolibacterium sp.]